MKIVGVADLPALDQEIEVDDYVPLTFHLPWPAQGMPRYVRFYPEDDAPLELSLVEDRHIVHGVVLLSMKRQHHVKTLDVLRRIDGAPVLDVEFPVARYGDESFAVDVPIRYSVALGSNFLEILAGNLEKADECIVSGRMEYYTLDREIVGLRCVDLNASQIETLQWHLKRSERSTMTSHNQ